MPKETSKLDNWLLIANGMPLSENKLQKLAIGKNVMVLDGAYEDAKRAGLKVDILLGDFDSISADFLAQAHKTDTLVVHTPDQNKTDLQKGLIYLDQLDAKSIYICCATGRRLQHTIYNLRMLKKFYNVKRPITLLTETETIRYYQDTDIHIEGKIGESIALLGFPQAIITTQGLKYEMTDCHLEFEQYIGVSNTLILEKVNIKVVGGALMIHEGNCRVDSE